MAIFASGEESKLHHLVGEEAHDGAETEFQAYGHLLALVSSFKYLGQVMTASVNDRMEVVTNMRKSWWKWAWMSKILVWEGENTRTSITFYTVVVKSVLFFGSEMWVTTPWIGQNLGGFHHRLALRLMWMQMNCNT